MNPYIQSTTVVRQLFVSEPLYDTIAVVDLVVVGTAPNQVFGLGSDKSSGTSEWEQRKPAWADEPGDPYIA